MARPSLFLDFGMYVSTLVLIILLVANSASVHTTDVITTTIDGTNTTTDGTNTTTDVITTTDVTKTTTDVTKTTTDVTTTTTAVTPATTAVTKPTEAPVQIWPDGTVYYKLSPSLTHLHINKINRVIAFIEYKTCIRFKKVSEKQKMKNVLVITGEGDRCSSELGWNQTWRQILALEIGIVKQGCFVYVKLLELFLRMLGFEGLTNYDYRIWGDRLGLRKKHLNKLNEMYDCIDYL